MTGTHGSPAPTRTAGAAADDSAGASLEDRLADRTRELDALSQQHAATVEILDIIARSPSGLQPVLDAVVGAAVRHCGADDAEVLLREGTEVFGAAHEGPLPSALGRRTPIEGRRFNTLIIRDGQTIHVPDTEALDPVDFASLIATTRQRGVRALVGAPIRHAGEVIGFLLLRRREVGPFSARQIAMLETLATQAGIAVANAGVITELRESLERQTATSDILRIISSSPTDIRPVFDAVAVAALRLCGAPGVGIILRDGMELVLVAFDGSLPAGPVGRRQPLDRTSLIGRAIIDGVTVHAPDVLALDPAEFGGGQETARRHGNRATLAAPLLREGRAVGGIVLAKPDPVAFTPRQIELLESFAAQAVIALENTRLFTELRESLDQQTATAEVLQVINASPGDTTPVFETILQKAHALCAIAYGSLQLYDGEKFRAVATHNLPQPLVKRLREGYVPGPNTRQLVDGAAFAQSADIGLVDEPMAKAAAEGGLRTLLRVALRKDGRLLGQIVCGRTEVRPFADREIALLQGFAAQAVIAMENARLITETREALDRQTAMAEVLAVINANPGELAPVFDTILDKALSLSGSSYGMLFRFDGERFWMVAVRNAPPAVRDLGQGGFLPEDGTLLHRMVVGDDVAYLADVTDDEAYRAGAPSRVLMADKAGARSLLTVALRKDGQLLGGIQVYRTEVRAFSEAEVTLVRSFADQAVIAMENARLLTETREALEQQTATAEILRIISQSPTNVQPVLDAVVETAARFCGAEDVTIALRDGDSWVGAAHVGPIRAVTGERIPLSRQTIMGRAIVDRCTMHVPDVEMLDPVEFAAGQALSARLGLRAMLVAPMLREGTAIGGISLRRATPGAFTERQIELAESLAAQAVIAIENVRLFTELGARNEDLRESLEQQTATADILRVISQSPTDIQPVLKAVVAAARRFCGATDAMVALRDGDESVTAAHEGPLGAVIGARARLDPRGRGTVRAIVERRTIHVPDVTAPDQHEFAISRALGSEQNFRAFITTPMMREGVAIGSIGLRRSNPGPFTPRQIALLETFAAQAVIAIENVRLFTELRESLEQQTATADILRVISQSPTDVGPVLDAVVKAAVRFCGAEDAVVALRDGEDHYFASAHDGPLAWVTGQRQPLDGTTALRRAMREARSFHLPDIAVADPVAFATEHRHAREFGYRAGLAAPMLREGVAIGAIGLRKREAGAITPRQVQLLESFAAQAVIAIENVRLFTELGARNEELREALEQQTATADILRVISQSPTDVGPVLEAVARAAVRFCGAEDAVVGLRDGEDHWTGAAHDGPFAWVTGQRQPLDGTTALRRAMREARSFHLPDIEVADPVAFATEHRQARAFGYRAGLAAPMLREGVAIGAIGLRKREAGAITPRQVQLLESFAAQAVIAIENVRLFTELGARNEELRESLEQQTATADILRVISQSPTDVQPVLSAVAKAALRFCGAPDALISMRDGDDWVAIAHEGALSAVIPLRRKLTRGSASGRCILDGRPVEIVDMDGADAAEFPESVDVARLGGWRSALAAPMLRDGVAIGTIFLRRPEPGPFTPRQLQLLESFAAQAVIAIENVRLFTELDARNTELREALEQQTATADILRVISQSPTDVGPVLRAVAAAALRFCGAADALVAVRDGDDAVIAAHEGPLGAVVGDRAPLDPRGRGTARAILERRTIHVPDVTAADQSEFVATRALGGEQNFRAFIVAPMMREDVAIGSIGLRKPDPGPFTPRQIALLESFAAQAVIAIENVRLFNELEGKNRTISEALEQQTATADILRVISQSPTNVQPVLDVVVVAARRFCGANDAVINFRDGDEVVVAAHDGSLSATLGARRRLDRSFGAGRAMIDGHTVHYPDVDALDPVVHSTTLALAREHGFRASVAVPMLREGTAVGSILLRKAEAGPFAVRQIALLESFAAQAVIAIENVRLFTELGARNAELRESLEQQTATADILRVISQSPTDVSPVLTAVASAALRFCGAPDAVITLRDGDEVVTIAHEGPLRTTIPLRRKLSTGSPSGRSIIECHPVEIVDIHGADAIAFPDVVELARQHGWRAALAAPMLREGVAVGSIFMRKLEPGRFTPRQIQLLEAFAAQAVIAIENVRLFTELDSRNTELRESLEQQTATAEVLATINANPGELGPVFDTMLTKAMLLCGATVGELRTYDGQDFRQAAARGMPDAYVDYYRNRSVSYGPGTGPARIVAGEPLVHIPDLIDTEAYRRGDPDRVALVELGGARASLIAPLLRGSEVAGMIMLLREQPGPFGDRQIALLQNFAAQAVIAIENARLITEQREALERQTVTADVLRVINANPGDVAPVFDTIVKESMRLCGAAFGMLYTRDGDSLKIGAMRGVPEAWARYRAANPAFVPGVHSLLRVDVYDGRRLSHTLDFRETEGYRAGEPNTRALVDIAGVRTLLMVPLVSDDTAVGHIALYRQEVNAFADKEIALVESFAAQAVIAMENARLIDEIRTARDAAETSLGELKIAQANLIQAEKMASLGQLTAGIAHEIKNPLNFVNNFATLSIELLDEVKEIAHPAIAQLDQNRRAELDETMDLLTGNLGKIAEHGKRADGIVKSMLSHSRSGKGDRAPSDINALVEEALTLAYHGARAQDKEFNITLERDYGPSGEPIDVVPQDITRVFLNLFGNGFYAANKRRLAGAEGGFRPTLSVGTRDLGDAVEVRVRDNGVGISPDARDKLFQPFFTTKPTGEGTGLGLSISYDIVTQQHGGSIEVESEPNSFTEFTVRLPRRGRAASPGERS